MGAKFEHIFHVLTKGVYKCFLKADVYGNLWHPASGQKILGVYKCFLKADVYGNFWHPASGQKIFCQYLGSPKLLSVLIIQTSGTLHFTVPK